jgi:hypothetical protein
MLLVAMVVAILLGPVVGPARAQETSSLQTRVQILHADSTVEKVEVFIDGEEILDNFAYGELSDWIELEPGSVRVTITADRAGANYVIFDSVYPALAGYTYYIVITELVIYSDAFDTSPVPDGSSRVRVVHTVPSLPPVDVAAVGADVMLAADLAYPRTSDYELVPAGTYEIEAVVALTGEVAVTAPGLVLESNTTYDLVLMGQPGDETHPLELRPLAAPTQDSATPVP